MGSRNKFEFVVKCPACGKQGTVRASEADGAAYHGNNKETRLEEMPAGFNFVDRPSRMATFDVECMEHPISAV